MSLTGRDRPVAIRASIGIATSDSGNAETVLRDADIALYAAKAAGRDCFRVFNPEMHSEIRAKADLSERLVIAVERDEFSLDYQPIFDLDAEIVTGVEALLRWKHPERGMVSASEFVPQLEETGLIVEVGRWVLGEACRQAQRWYAEGHPIDLSVNASIRQITSGSFVDDVQDALAATQLNPSSLVIEISEAAVSGELETTVPVLRRLKQLGVRLAIDDFGAGYSSFLALRRCPVDTIKLDRRLITSLTDRPDSGEVVHTLVWLAKALNLNTLAKGIEKRQQLELLHQEGGVSGQGYVLAPPVSAAAVTELLAEHGAQRMARLR